MGFETIALVPRPAAVYPSTVKTQTPETAEPAGTLQPATPAPTTPSPGAAKPRSNVASVDTAIREMRSKADVKLKSLLGDGFVQPATHYDYVVRTAEAMKTLKTPAERAAFKNEIGDIGAPLGINFGLSLTSPGRAAGVPLNDGVFKGLDAQSKARQAHDVLATEFNAGKSAAAAQAPTTPAVTPTGTQGGDVATPTTPVGTAPNTPSTASQEASIRAVLTPMANADGKIGAAELDASSLPAAAKTALKEQLKAVPNQQMTVDEMTALVVKLSGGTGQAETPSGTQPASPTTPATPTTPTTATTPSNAKDYEPARTPGIQNKLEATVTYVQKLDTNSDGLIDLSELKQMNLTTAAKDQLTKTLTAAPNQRMSVTELSNLLMNLSGANPPDAKPR